VLAVAVAVQLVPLAAPLLLSSDAWTYWSYGRLAAVHGLSPYDAAPSDVPADPSFPWVGAAWRDQTSVYGPAFTLASEPVALAAGESAGRAAWLFKALAAAATLGTALLAAALSRRPVFALAFVGWNPLLALHFAGGGHNDAWLAAAVLGALVLSARGRLQWAGALWAVSILLKWVPLVLLPLRALEARRTGRPVAHVGFALAAAILAVAATWRYGPRWLLAPLGSADLRTSYALPSRLEGLGVGHGAAVAALGVGYALVYAWLLREAWRGRARLGLATGLLLLAVPYLAVWYVAWTVPLAAAEDDEPALLLALALCAYLLPQTIPL
jgi:hypothetical protein